MEPGAMIRSLRLAKGLSQIDLAVAIGCDRSTISNIERGHDLPGRETLRALADFFQVSADTILARKADDTSAQSMDEMELLRLYREVPDAAREGALAMLRALRKQRPQN